MIDVALVLNLRRCRSLDLQEVIQSSAAVVLSGLVPVESDNVPKPHHEADLLALLEGVAVDGEDFDGYFDGPTETSVVSWDEFRQRMAERNAAEGRGPVRQPDDGGPA